MNVSSNDTSSLMALLGNDHNHEIINARSSSGVEGIVVNRTLPQVKQETTAQVELYRLELEQGGYQGTRDFFAKLRFDNDARSACMDRLAQGYRSGSTSTSNTNHHEGAMATLATLQQWAKCEPDNKDAQLLFGLILITSAWRSLSPTNSRDLSEQEQFRAFSRRASKAEQALQSAMDIDPSDPLPYATMLTATRELGKLRTTFQKFQQNCKDPHNLNVHQVMLLRLTPHWGGSLPEMLDFARSATVASKSPPPKGHPLWSLLAKAHLLAWEELKTAADATSRTSPQRLEEAQASTELSSYWKDRSIGREIVKTYRKYRASKFKGASSSSSEESEIACSNLFAFCLFKCKAYKDANPEFTNIAIRGGPTEEPWNKESKLHWKQVYERARSKISTRENDKQQQDPTRRPFDGNGSYNSTTATDYSSMGDSFSSLTIGGSSNHSLGFGGSGSSLSLSNHSSHHHKDGSLSGSGHRGRRR
ncbi:expressed unknown protein [Seminavis robusta]|uniref:Uncharacterized protein n=1 Tax=Seminavis robusta TaxID=568900 RepID=A0A9N8D4W0_9STRA|nr:expressed unknown protein [Seminavis robusta]|eukprot:Sro1_g000960.1 n/a (477) ;mRNA; f:295579-297009